ncbi:Response regulator ArlR [Planctomycetes bacterium Pan216]|uniref:Response regulator ArlR n=1 Tax=Kolteria novifilia TaxID=2527975 RepID=A0A518AZ87_9BACT|nr:Response regulator ArlR [Planctomycetes bacterium Pan216]
MGNKSILILGDGTEDVLRLRDGLDKEGFNTLLHRRRFTGPVQISDDEADLILVDLDQSGTMGVNICREIRQKPRLRIAPMMVISGRDDEAEEVLSFRMGADDFVQRPFRTRALVERIRARFRRPELHDPAGDMATSQGIEIDRVSYRVTLDGKELSVTPTEFNIIWHLVCHPGKVFGRNDLLKICVGTDSSTMQRSIDVHIRSLRRKFGQRASLIETVRGVGYRLRGHVFP